MNNHQLALVQASQQLQTVLNACDAAVSAAKEVHVRKVEIANSLFSNKMADLNETILAGRTALRRERGELMSAHLKPLQDAYDLAVEAEERLLEGLALGRRDRARIEAARVAIEDMQLDVLAATPDYAQNETARRAMLVHLDNMDGQVAGLATTDGACEGANDQMMVAKRALYEARQAFVAETEALVESQWPDREAEKLALRNQRDRALERADAELQLSLDRIANHRQEALRAF